MLDPTATSDTSTSEGPSPKPKKKRKPVAKSSAKKTAKRSAKPAAKRPTKGKSSGKAVIASGKGKNRFALNMWVTATQRDALKKLAKKRGTSIVGMLRKALKLPE